MMNTETFLFVNRDRISKTSKEVRLNRLNPSVIIGMLPNVQQALILYKRLDIFLTCHYAMDEGGLFIEAVVFE